MSSPHDLSVVVVLHGLGGDAAGTARGVALAMASPQIPRSEAGRFAVVTVDGGTTYWHRRAEGDDPQGMIIHEVLPPYGTSRPTSPAAAAIPSRDGSIASRPAAATDRHAGRRGHRDGLP